MKRYLREIYCPPQEQGPHRGPCMQVSPDIAKCCFVSLLGLELEMDINYRVFHFIGFHDAFGGFYYHMINEIQSKGVLV